MTTVTAPRYARRCAARSGGVLHGGRAGRGRRVDPWRLGGELWGGGARAWTGLCFSGANLVPLRGERAASRQFADRARRGGRSCSSLVGRAELVLADVGELAPAWGPPARCVPTSR